MFFKSEKSKIKIKTIVLILHLTGGTPVHHHHKLRGEHHRLQHRRRLWRGVQRPPTLGAHAEPDTHRAHQEGGGQRAGDIHQGGQ